MNKMRQWLVAGASFFMLSIAGLCQVAWAQIVQEETQTGGAIKSPTVTTSASLTGVNGHLYLAAIVTKSKSTVKSVSGLGLTWSSLKSQCTGRNGASVEIWMAQGTPTGNGAVTVSFADSAVSPIIAVSRYSGVHATSPVGNVISGNTNGANGVCTGGVDTSFYSFNLTTTANGAMVYGAATMRTKLHTPGAGYTERVELKQGSSGNTASLAVEDKSIATASTVTVDGTFNGNADWAVVALEIKPVGSGGGSTQRTLTVNTVGSGSVSLNPPGGTYNDGTAVTLTATPAAGFQFNGWSGDLSGSANPATITMNTNKNVTATFTAITYKLTVNTVGSGSVSLNPAGGVYNPGTVVTLTATPAAGNQFSGWSGALSGSANPTTITMNANKNVTATFTGGGSSGQVALEETQTGGAIKSPSVSTSTSLTGVNGHLYLAAIVTKSKTAINSVSGLGLIWSSLKSQCTGRNGASVEVWMAQGTPTSNGAVTVTFADSAVSPIIAVSRYSGVHAANPIGNVISGNTNGSNGVCTGGVDTSFYSFNLTTTANGAMVYGAVTMRTKLHTPGAGYTERVELQRGSGGNTASLAVEDRGVATISTVTVDGTFNGIADWAVVAIEIKPAGSGSGSTQRTLTVNTVGSGSVNPSGGTFSDGAVVTLTATPAAGFQFSGWSGDLTGSTNPTTITMNANKSVTAMFTAIPSSGPIVYEESQTGGSSGSTTVTTSASLTGVSDNLYLAAISTRPKKLVLFVSGLGLNWTLAKSICAGRSTTGMDVWMAQGTPSGNDAVTATFGSAPSTAIIAVSRYSGVAATNPLGNVIAGNTNGLNGACSGGVDGSSYSFNLATTVNDAVVYGAVGIKARTHTPGAGYIEGVEIQHPDAINPIGIAVEDKNVASASTVTVDGSFDGAVDWALVALEIKPQSTGPVQHTLTVNTVGSGSVTLNPPGGVYNDGTVVTLTAAPAAGFQFSGWSGDLTGSTNPATITMDANKSVTATFVVSGTDPNTNLAKNQAVIASSSYPGKPPSNAVDGSTSTYWRSDGSVSSSNPFAWLRVDLGAALPIGRAIVEWKESYYAKSYELQVSNDDVNWTKVYGTTAGSSGSQQFVFPQTTARYVRFYMTKNVKSNYQIYELEVYSGSSALAKRSDEDIAVAAIPNEFVLDQNYPNPFGRLPFNSSTKIRFGLPQASRVTIKVYTIHGEEVAMLVNGHYPAGAHTVVFQPRNLPSGVYIAVLKAGEVTQVRRMTFMK